MSRIHTIGNVTGMADKPIARDRPDESLIRILVRSPMLSMCPELTIADFVLLALAQRAGPKPTGVCFFNQREESLKRCPG